MRSGGGDYFKSTAFAQFAKRAKQIAFAFIDKEALGFAKDFRIKICELANLRAIAVPFSFTRSEIDQQIEMLHVTLAQKPILKHRAEGRRDRHGELERHTLIDQALHHAH